MKNLQEPGLVSRARIIPFSEEFPMVIHEGDQFLLLGKELVDDTTLEDGRLVQVA